jgi:hypothetical protein
MTRPSNLSLPSRRQFLVGSAATTLSAAAVATLAGRPTLAAAKGESLYESADPIDDFATPYCPETDSATSQAAWR